MSGEFQLAQQTLQQMLEAANASPECSVDAAERALLTCLLEQRAKNHSAQDLQREISYLLENIDNDEEYVITRGC